MNSLVNTQPLTRHISPPKEAFSDLSQPLEPGERDLIEALDQQLPVYWEIYVQPHVNGLCPDIVLLNPQVGVVVIEVKDWDFSCMQYSWELKHHDRAKKLWANYQGKKFRIQSPIDKAKIYGDEIRNLYCPSLGAKRGFTPVVCSLVYFSKLSCEEAHQFIKESLIHNTSEDLIKTYFPAIGYDALIGDLSSYVPFFANTSSRYMTEDYAEDLRVWLGEPRHKAEQRKPVQLSRAQKDVLKKDRTRSGLRRIRGSAGSGKSLTLAAKAVEAQRQGQKVLLVTYNITLINYLGDMIARTAEHETGIRRTITRLNYHLWAKRTCFDLGYADEYKALPWEDDPDHVLNKALPDLLLSIPDTAITPAHMFDLILVDEGQDFRLEWWKSLIRFREKSGQAILVADKTQDVYGTASAWTEEAMHDSGFTGAWGELKVSYRLPTDYVLYIKDYLDRFIDSSSQIPPEPPQNDLPGMQKTHMEWIQVSTPEESIDECVSSVLDLPIKRKHSDPVVYADITLMADTIKDGYEIVRKLGLKGVKVKHTFGLSGDGNDEDKIRPQKMAFFLGSEQVKATTIHSFKGWESSCVVIQIKDAHDAIHLAAVYAALTRLKSCETGQDSHIVVVCCAPELADYGQTWPSYRNHAQQQNR